LHDIGKAMTHDHEGSHAVLGAQVARRCGEDELIANAIGSHHNDEPPHGPIALVVTAADAMSGARPGARRENAAAYMGRLHDINRIASAFPHVERVDIMHAGREVRVVVASDERGSIDERHHGPALKDADLFPLAQKIARTLEEEITYAGQIRVTVIRETRSISVAS
jgi:ribonuclease Y